MYSKKLNNDAMPHCSIYLRARYYFYTYKQLYVISFLFFDKLAIVARMTLLFQYCEW